jgi:hypothetical protein
VGYIHKYIPQDNKGRTAAQDQKFVQALEDTKVMQIPKASMTAQMTIHRTIQLYVDDHPLVFDEPR